MTVTRQNPTRAIPQLAARILLAILLFVITGAAIVTRARAGLTERIVVDWHTGLALGGYDPVAYFTSAKPTPGSGKIELRYDGVVWRFCNVGNRAAFAQNPRIYMPEYGGYDPVAIAQGIAVPGNPDVWTIAGKRLYLFYDRAQRNKFAAQMAWLIAAANRQWPRLLRTLGP
jgi:hypothetical protein